MDHLRDLLLTRTDLAARMAQGAASAVVFSAFAMAFQLSVIPGSIGFGVLVILFTAILAGGAVAGVVYFATEGLRSRAQPWKLLANVVTLLLYCALVFLFLALAVAITQPG